MFDSQLVNLALLCKKLLKILFNILASTLILCLDIGPPVGEKLTVRGLFLSQVASVHGTQTPGHRQDCYV